MLMISQSLRIRNLGPESWVPWVCVSGSLRGLLVTAEAAGISRVNGEGSASQLTHVAVVAAGRIQFLMDWCTHPLVPHWLLITHCPQFPAMWSSPSLTTCMVA